MKLVMYQALLVNHSLIVLAHKFHIFGNFLMQFNFPPSMQCWNLGLILEFSNLCMCHVLVSPNATHASSLILLAWQVLLVSYFSYALWWCHDPWFTVPRRNLGSPMDCSHKEILLGARWYRGLWSWSIIAPQLMWFTHLGTLIWNSCSIIPLKLLNPLSLTTVFWSRLQFLVNFCCFMNNLKVNVFDTFPFPLLNPTLFTLCNLGTRFL